METSAVPFVEHNGLEIDENGTVLLPFQQTVQNHLSSVHAGAQFLLAESASGYYLMSAFPELMGQIIPLLRESRLKYIQQAQGRLSSRVLVSEDTTVKFLQTIKARGRAVITLGVEVVDDDDKITCSGDFKWFVQLTEQ